MGDSTLSVTKNSSRLGTITSTPAGVICAVSCDLGVSSFSKGQRVSLNAAPARGKKFVRWTGACSGNKPNCAVVMDGNKAVSAVFK